MGFRPDLLLAHEFPEARQRYARRDAILYALGVGLGVDPIDPADLPFLLEDRLAVLPTFAVTLGSPGMWIRAPEFARRFCQAGSLRTDRDVPRALAARGRGREPRAGALGDGQGRGEGRDRRA